MEILLKLKEVKLAAFPSCSDIVLPFCIISIVRIVDMSWRESFPLLQDKTHSVSIYIQTYIYMYILHEVEKY